MFSLAKFLELFHQTELLDLLNSTYNRKTKPKFCQFVLKKVIPKQILKPNLDPNTKA